MEASEEYYFFKEHSFLMELIAGGCCGLAVDTFLFPIDTCKTRLQSENGFWKAGGFRSIYNGILPVIAASVPIAATFFLVYGTVKDFVPLIINWFFINSFTFTSDGAEPTVESAALKFLIKFGINSFAASLGEICAGLIRVPIEIVKQKRQVSKIQYRAIDILMHAYKSDGLFNGIYRGYGITIMRDIPFSMIQYPTWELLTSITTTNLSGNLKVFVEACDGSVAGALASAITTPLDVAKTRIQLADLEPSSEYNIQNRNPLRILRSLYRQKGIKGIFSGFVPRVMWTTVGGFIWFGTYKLVKYLLERL
ncbi:S-adenosylmethionine mitochondrial carrier protein homolog [Sitodiplosis mosellana]|uniref:S-adenosylmethionine mitochondrial carrier protein homolog n=1 Tax=Sitodiplosis mosellana TaxID=263140 RepID=UPI002444F339|nr:S-adenosylmethionine mitochondrial carrier protein homolog [Sitodiplosis mosellana]